MDIIEVLDKLSAIVNTEELKQSVHVACVLRESIAANQGNTTAESSGKMSHLMGREQMILAYQLRNALTTLQVLAVDYSFELASEIGNEMLQRVAEVVIQLDEDLNDVIATVQTISPKIGIVDDAVQEKIRESQVAQGLKEQVASVIAIANQGIVKEELLPANSIRDTAVVEQITAIDSTNETEEVTRSKDNVVIDKKGNLVNPEKIYDETVTLAALLLGVILKPTDETIVKHNVVTTVEKSARANSKSAYFYCFIFLKSQSIYLQILNFLLFY